MRKFNEANERIKNAYIVFLRESEGLDEQSIDKVLAAILRFEESTQFKPFKKFHIDQPKQFKIALAKAKNARTGKPLGHSTIDSILRLNKAFFKWLAGRPGYKSVLSYADANYFNNTAKSARIAHAERIIPYPSMQQALRTFEAMPNETDLQKRNKALFAFFMLTGIRDGAAASLKLKHINLEDGEVFQDGREVKTKNSKTFYTWFFPVDAVYRNCFTAWVMYLRDDLLFGADDALFPKQETRAGSGSFKSVGLSREPYADAAKLNAAIREAFESVQMRPYTAHAFRKTLGHYSNEVCTTLEEFKAWSMNLGHENMATTISAYMPVNAQRQRELIKGLAGKQDAA